MGCPSSGTSFHSKAPQKQRALCSLTCCWMFHRLGAGGVGTTALASANMHCKEEKYIARSCGACKPEFAFLKYFSFNNPLEYN